MTMDVYSSECIRAANEIQVYQKDLNDRFLSGQADVVRQEYFSGGDRMHRGFYCPSLILDLVVGNAHRGKRLLCSRSEQAASFVFGFDKEDQLITVTHENERELIWREEGIEIGLVFHPEFGVSMLAECIYKGNRLLSYTLFLYHPHDNSVATMTRESYSYEKGRMTVQYISFLNAPQPLLQQEQYFFGVEGDLLKEYTVYRENQPPQIYPVRKTRRILDEQF